MTARLEDFLTDDSPLGPLDSAKIDDQRIFSLLFEENSPAYKFNKSNPSIIVGRRGSGKTGYLMNLLNDQSPNRKYSLCVMVDSARAFSEVANAITELSDKKSSAFSEEIAEVWELLLYIIVIKKIKELKKNYDTSSYYSIGQIAKKLPLDEIADISTFILSITKAVDDASTGSAALRAVSQILKYFIPDDHVTLIRIRKDLHDFFKKNGISVCILIDTLEDYMLEEELNQKALMGLIRCVGQFNIVDRNISVRLCVPGEIFRAIDSLSTNTRKDFSHQVILQWHAGDLVCLAAQRYFCCVYVVKQLQSQVSLEKRLDFLSKRANALAYFDEIFPKHFRNGFGIEERPIAYVLRHTQLLPRQILFFLQELIVVARNRGEDPEAISELTLTLALKRVEEGLVKEVCQGFRYLYPDCYSLVKFLRSKLNRVFTERDFQRSFNQEHAKFIESGSMKYYEALRALVNIGAIGKHIKSTERFEEAIFEYVGNGEVDTADAAKLCIHPLFNGRPLADLQAAKLIGKPIYPYGSNPEGLNDVSLLL